MSFIEMNHLGFEYPQYFSRLFKKRTEVSPDGYWAAAAQ